MRAVAVLVSCAMLFLWAPERSAREPATTLAEVAGFADWIFVGRVAEVGESVALYDIYGPAAVLQIHVIKQICGEPFAIGLPPGQLQVLYRPNQLERPPFTRDKNYVFFWKNTSAGPVLAPGHYGALEINDGLVSTRLLEGALAETPLGELAAALTCSQQRP